MRSVVSNNPIPKLKKCKTGFQRHRVDMCKGVAIELASAIRDTEGFVLDPVEHVKAVTGVLQLQLTESKSNDEDKKPFLLHIGVGNALWEKRLAMVWAEVFPRDSWAFVLEHCKHEIAWNRWKKECEKKENKETAKRKGGVSIRALKM